MTGQIIPSNTPTQLSKAECQQLSKLESVISKGVKAFMQVGFSLREIRDERLYRQEYSTFENYCRIKWGWARRYCDRVIEAGDIANSLRPMGLVSNERQARELAKVKDDADRDLIWIEINETHKPKEITAKLIRETVKGWYIHDGDDDVEADDDDTGSGYGGQAPPTAHASSAVEVDAEVIRETAVTAQGDRIAPPTWRRSHARFEVVQALDHLQNIRKTDPHRIAAIKKVMAWCEEQLP